MLTLVGLGLDQGEITQKGLKAVENAEKVYAEFYTNTENIDLERLPGEIEKLSREEVEQQDTVLDAASNHDTVFLVSGDPLSATTHYDIKHRAEKQGITVKTVHAPSIFTSVTETGLNIYKFGRTVTLPEESAPESILKHIEKNSSVGLHTLILLDIDYPANKAAEKLLELDEGLSKREAVVLERANTESQELSVSTLEEVAEKGFGEPPHSLILPGEKSHKEEEFLEAYR